MKKLFTLLSLFAFIGFKAQVVTSMSLSATHFTNTTAQTATLQTDYVTENISLQAVVTKSTGTVDGYVSLAVSLDGTNYVTQNDSLNLADEDVQTKVWELTNNNYKFYKLIFQGAGTMDAEITSAKLFSSGLTNKHVISNMYVIPGTYSVTQTNTLPTWLYLPVQNWYNTITFQHVVTKVSGTVAGTVTLQGSLDNENFVTVDSNYATVTSYNPTNVATQSKIFVITGAPYRYYRIQYDGAGTMVATHRCYVLPNKK